MRRSRLSLKSVLGSSALGVALACGAASLAQPPAKPVPPANSDVQLVQDVTPVQPATPVTPFQPDTTAPTGVGLGLGSGGLFGGVGNVQGGTSAERQAEAATPGSSFIGAGEAQSRATSDVGDLLGKSDSATGVIVQRRTTIVTDPRVRGYHVNQLLTVADGAYWFPARLDLDTIVSKIDSNAIRDVIVLKGPYSVRYGPGFSFLDIETNDTPRYQKGLEGHGRSFLTYKTNAEQWHGHQAFWGGSNDWGFRLGWDINVGNDYETGNGSTLPTSFNSQTWDFSYGFDISEDSHFEFKGMRLNQGPVEFPGLVFDVNRLLTDGYTGRYVLEDQQWFNRMVVEGWYNLTRFTGDNLRTGKRAEIPQLDTPLGLIGFTEADAISTGMRSYVTWGKDKEPQLTVGADVRFLSQYLNEFDIATAFTSRNFAIPRSHSVNPGIFVDDMVPVTERWTLKSGARFDLVTTDIDEIPPPFGEELTETEYLTFMRRTLFPDGSTEPFRNDYFMWAVYGTSEYELTKKMTATAGLGFAQRPPSITELYALGPLLGILQNGLNFVNGAPNLRPEKTIQFDLGLRYNSERFRAGVNGFYIWVRDYITFEVTSVTAGLGLNSGLGVQYVNTDLATLSGFEVYGEADWTETVTPFMTMSFVEGRDQTRDNRGNPTVIAAFPELASGPQEPLPQIPPLETRVGVRLHEAGDNPGYGLEFAARIVAAQNRFAKSLAEVATPGFATFDVRTYWRASESLLLTAGVENLGDRYYREHLDLRTGRGVFQPGRNFYVGAQVQY